MKKLIIGFLAGIILSAAIFIPLVLNQQKAKFEFGRHQGQIDGCFWVWQFLDKHFGQNKIPYSQTKDSFPVKDLEIRVVETNGVLTIATK